ncbi:carbon-nitrogen hydrolase [Hirsutella rhossiliensis]|uniref:Glutamine-dependent NAD(+) synthetase n=1 Tax=Hirsutella rhossiliensis TaxID=111463 RepID=A0A9P8MNW5_9HYPO|nr:carbon-nitrogen hydrolase domain-containing protein [Hirsutella rhossiliensis]KAH0957839.1 carbon-nitrogen hydrolase domain-containing protein [Hirsutella rhossiliensis]
MSFVTVAAATLPSVPLDFVGNRDRILESIRIAKEKGASLRTGPELEIPGYGCLDHHLESDTELHSWEVLADVISNDVCRGILVDLGMGVKARNVQYNCRVLCTYRKVFAVRAKQALAGDGLYREARHFTAWVKERQVEAYKLHQVVKDVTGQKTVPIGDFILETPDTSVTCETCEELFVPRNPSIFTGLNGAEIILNSSASHAELRKLEKRLNLISNSTRSNGGLYVYANATGVDGEARMLFDGSSMIIQNGEVLAQSSQFSLAPVEVTVATVDLERVRSYRTSHSRNIQAAQQPEYPRVECDMALCRPGADMFLSDKVISTEIPIKILNPMEEIYMATSVYLWQYLVRSSSAGFFIALSGGLDSSTVALFVYGMARLVLLSIRSGQDSTLHDLRRAVGEKDYSPKSPEEIVSKLLHTCFMGTVNSSDETRSRAKRLAERIGAYHTDINIDQAIRAHESIVEQSLGGFKPRFSVEGGTVNENLAKQNIQARNRMVVAYELAQLSTQARGLPRAGAALLVLGSGNVDENLRGYYTKYDASSADLAPLGSISKNDAKDFQRWARDNWDLPIMDEFIEATPSAELLPLSAGVQADEVEMGLTYSELSDLGILRKVDKLGPWSAYLRLLSQWKERPGFGPREIAEKVYRFYRFYAINRHKATIITPSVHLSGYNPDDNRHDLRPFLYVVNWPWQFGKIKEHVEHLESKIKEKRGAKA